MVISGGAADCLFGNLGAKAFRYHLARALGMDFRNGLKIHRNFIVTTTVRNYGKEVVVIEFGRRKLELILEFVQVWRHLISGGFPLWHPFSRQNLLNVPFRASL